jgi:hypothetical protein
MNPLQEQWIVWTARVAVALYLGALLAGTRPRRVDSGPAPRRLLADLLWTAAGITFVVHVGLAFQFLHHWSHESAFRHTAERTDQAMGVAVGVGIYVNYVFLLWWVTDLVLLWGAPGRRTRRYRIALHAFFAFIMFNATFVFGPPWWRWASLPIAAGMLAGRALMLRSGTAQAALSERPAEERVASPTET